MPETALGTLLRTLREQRQLSPREVARLSEIDHAYIYRLETGEKDSPSDDAIAKLIKGLRPGRREAEMLRYLGAHPSVDPALVKFVMQDESVTFNVFTAVAGAVYRGTARPDYAKMIERMKRMLAEDGDE